MYFQYPTCFPRPRALHRFPSLPCTQTGRSRTLGLYTGLSTGVRVSSTPNAHLSSLFADQHCGEGTKLILYMQAGSVLSRGFTSKDTHTPRGELLVVYGDARKSYLDAEIARETAVVRAIASLRPAFRHTIDSLRSAKNCAPAPFVSVACLNTALKCR